MAANDDLMDAAIQHQIDLGRYSRGVVQRMVAILNRVDRSIFADLAAKLATMEPEQFTVTRLEAMLGSVRALNAQAYAQIDKELRAELKDFTEYEVSYQKMALESVLPAQIVVAGVSAEQVYAGAMARPFQGTLLKGALDELEAGRARRIRQSIAQGYVEGKTSVEIVRELRGTRARQHADGFLEVDRRHLQTIVNTAIAHTAHFAQERFYDANTDLLKGVQWSAKLDLRTSSTCRLRDGLMWTPDRKPIGHAIPWRGGPPAHFNCRSTAVPVLKGLGDLLDADLSESDFPAATRASLDGQVAANETYAEWIKRQSARRQDDVLGPTRGKLLRDGKLPLSDMYSPRGELLTLDELRAKSSAAFGRVGL